MNKPIIDPQTLTEEQKEEIRSEFNTNEFYQKKYGSDEATDHWYSGRNLTLLWLFGEDFFKGCVAASTAKHPTAIINLTAMMRDAQREYFRTRDHEVLRKSKALEKRVDAEIAQFKQKKTGENEYGTLPLF